MSEEMDEAAEKEGQAEKNRKQAEENRQRIEALEEALGNQVEEVLEETLKEKVEGLKDDLKEDLSQIVEERVSQVSQEQGAVREMREAVQKAVQETLSEGVPLKGEREFRQLREKIGRFMRRARTMTELMDAKEGAQRRVTKALKNVRERGKEARKEMRAKTRLVESSAKALDGAWWKVAVPTVLTVAVAFLGVIAWGTVETIPRAWRTTEEEQVDIREMRRLERATGAMTDEQLEQFRTLLQKAEKQEKESSEPQD